jgi:phosphoglucomutase
MISNTSEVVQQAQKWCEAPFDAKTREETMKLIEKGGDALEDAFYKDLEFGTGGMRGIMGVGTNRVNAYTLGMATQGLANYLHKKFKGEEISAAIAYDCRNNSDTLAQVVADVLTANDIKVYLFESLRPTPELSFAVRYLNCHRRHCAYLPLTIQRSTMAIKCIGRTEHRLSHRMIKELLMK